MVDEFCGLESVDPHDAEDEIMARVAEGDEKTIQAIKEGATAALEAADSIVLPAMALVARSYRQGHVPPWFLRGVLQLLKSLSASEYGNLRDLMHSATAKLHSPAHDEARIVANRRGTTLNSSPLEGLPPIAGSVHLFSEMKRHGLGHENGGAGVSGHPTVIWFDPRVVFWLRDCLPDRRPVESR